MNKIDSIEAKSERELVITRTYDAPRDLVFKAWTEADRLKHWWGPKGFAMVSCKLDLRSGGVFLYGLRAQNGSDMWGKWVFREILPPERLVFVASFSDQDGNTVRAPFSSDWPIETLSTVTFTEQSGRTTITMRAVPINQTEIERRMFESMFGSMQNGWKGTLDQLQQYLSEA